MIRTRAFTLIELLVVIAVLAMLIGLVLVGIPILQRNSRALVTTQRIEDITSNLTLIATSEGGPAMRLLWGMEIRPGITLGAECDKTGATQPYPFRTPAPWGEPDLFDRELTLSATSVEGRRVQRLRCWIDKRSPVEHPNAPDQAGIEFTPTFSSELLGLAAVVTDPEAYARDRSANRAWNDRWGNPLAVGLLVYEPRVAPDGGDFRDFLALPANQKLADSLRQSPSRKPSATNPLQNERIWDLSRGRYGYNRMLYVMVAAAGTIRRPDPTTDADPTAVWNDTCARFAAVGLLWDDAAQTDPPYRGVGRAKDRTGVCLLSAPTVLR